MSDVDDMAVGALTGDAVVATSPDANLFEVADALAEAGVGLALVGAPDDVKGVVSERDVVRALAQRRDLETTRASEIASQDVIWVDAGATVAEVAEEMLERWVRHVLVETGGRLVGVVSGRDLLGVYASAADGE